MWKTSAKRLARLLPIPSSRHMSKRSMVSMFTPSTLPRCGTSWASSYTKVLTRSHSQKGKSASAPTTNKLQYWMRSSITELSKLKANRQRLAFLKKRRKVLLDYRILTKFFKDKFAFICWVYNIGDFSCYRMTVVVRYYYCNFFIDIPIAKAFNGNAITVNAY